MLVIAVVGSWWVNRRFHSRPRSRDVREEQFAQILDHFSGSNDTFSQRFWEVRNWAVEPIRNVILSIGGEGDGGGADGLRDAVADFARDLNAVVLTLEHRFYGTSFPEGGASTDNYKQYLTVEQAIDDLNYFAQVMRRDRYPDTKWMLIGGSYPGALASWTRRAHPETFHAALASSGVVLAIDDFYEYDLQVGIGLGEECAAILRQVQWRIQEELNSGDAKRIRTQLELLNLYSEADDWQKDVLFAIGDAAAGDVQYSTRRRVCAPLLDSVVLGKDPMIAFGQYVRDSFGDNVSAIVEGYSRHSLKAMESAQDSVAARSWTWQTCSQMGWWQTQSGRLSLRPANLTVAAYDDLCTFVFGNGSFSRNITAFNERHGGLSQNVSHVFYSTGSQDPWTWACITPDRVPAGSVAHNMIGDDVGHCRDYYSPAARDPVDVNRTRLLERALFKKWMAED